MSHYNNKSARSEAQLKHMQDLARRKICIFCPENIHEDKNKIEIETAHWLVKKNSYPYEHTKLHLILIPKKHVKTISELPTESMSEFLALVAACENKYKLASYAVGIRSGDMRLNGGSIEHLHAHLVVGDTNNPDHRPVRFKMSNRP